MTWAPEEVSRMAETKEMEIKTTPPQLVAYTVHKGPYSHLGEVFMRVAKWARENGYEIAGPPRTIYYSEAGSVPDEELITEVQIPIRRTKGLTY